MTAPVRAADAAGEERLTVGLGARAYDIVIGEGLIADAGRHLRPLLKLPQVVIVTDTNVAAKHLDPFRAGLERAGIASEPIILPPGESTKSFCELENLSENILALGIERSTVLVALGGGVIGDLTGFAAAILLRGIDFVQVPTTLLAQVDSAVGGKTGINTRQGKNLVGSFHQPRLVLADMGVLDTLPPRELLAGYAEIVKYGLINDAGFFAWLEANGRALIAGDRALRRHAVRVSCAAKAAIVAADEREKGERALLNLGHTFGHALEAETGFGPALIHGEAVAVGLALAFDFSARLGLCPAEDAAHVRRHLDEVGLPAALDRLGDYGRKDGWTAARLMAHMGRDKKVAGGKLTFILARGIGRAFVSHDVDEAELGRFLADRLGG
ncbi:MAG: 3-dehydroquinate synthase [Rhodospirillales bacterium]|nr:3-dehydroquinate synthase [Rhodospirillales bacterium]